MKQLNSHAKATEQLYQQYATTIASGERVPFVYPLASIGAAVGLLFFLIPPTSPFHNRFSRYLTFAFIFASHAYIVNACLGMNPSTGFGVGGIATFGTMWAGVLLVFHDAKAEFKRVQRRPALASSDARGDGDISSGTVSSVISKNDPSASQQWEYYWQPYPSSVKARVYWSLDLWTNFRLLGWDHMLTTMPTYPHRVQTQLDENAKKESMVVDQPVAKVGLRRYDDMAPLVRHNGWLFLKSYLILDLISTLTRHDPYFQGIVDTTPPSGLPSFMLAAPGFWVKGYRLTAGMVFVWLGLRNILVLAPICIPSIFSDRLIGVWSEPWLYPDHYGNYAVVLNKGLAGWWGGWWHQSFRCAFLAASNWLIDIMGVARQSATAKIITVLISFLLSGLIHTGGSMTQPGPTDPLQGPMAFFMLQPLGLGLEQLWHTAVKRSGVSERIPAWLASYINFIWVHAWFWLTAPLLVEDMAKGGLWLYQPVPVSPARALFGLGVKGDGAFCWQGRLAQWHKGSSWVSSGIAL